MYYFSPSTLAFYPEELLEVYEAAGTLPDDIIEMDEGVFEEFSNNPPAGYQRGADKDGHPEWHLIPVIPKTDEEIYNENATTARRYRDSFLKCTDRMMLGDFSIDDVLMTQEQFNEVLAIRTEFKAWPKQDGWPLIEIPEIPQWILVEAANNGFVVLTWPPVVETEVNEPDEPETK